MTGSHPASQRRLYRLCEKVAGGDNYRLICFSFMEKSRLAVDTGHLSEIVNPLQVALEAASHLEDKKYERQMRLELIDRLLEYEKIDNAQTHLAQIDGEYLRGEWDEYDPMFHLQYFKRKSILASLLGDKEGATRWADRAMEYVEQHPSKSARSQVLLARSAAKELNGDLTNALSDMAEAVALLEEIASVGLLDGQLRQTMLLLRAHDPKRAFEVARQLLNNGSDADPLFRVAEMLCELTRIAVEEHPSTDRLLSLVEAVSNNSEVDSVIADAYELVLDVCLQMENLDAARRCYSILEGFTSDKVIGARRNRLLEFQNRMQRLT